jgi:hypothetical protein
MAMPEASSDRKEHSNWASVAEKAKLDVDVFATGKAANGERLMTEADLMQARKHPLFTRQESF